MTVELSRSPVSNVTARNARVSSAAAAAFEALAARKRAFLGGGGEAAMAVAVGNRAGDLDSIASALAAAHLSGGVAVARFRRRDLALRRDAAVALERCGGSEDALASASDVGPARVVLLETDVSLAPTPFATRPFGWW